MKKLLLTLGTAASVATPLATVVACGDDAVVSPVKVEYDVETKTIFVTGFVLDISESTSDQIAVYSDLWKQINKSAYAEATTVSLEVTSNDDPEHFVTQTTKLTVDEMFPDVGPTIGDLAKHTWDKVELEGVTIPASAQPAMRITVAIMNQIGVEMRAEMADIATKIEALTLQSNFADASEYKADAPNAIDAATALEYYGIPETEFDKLIAVFPVSEEVEPTSVIVDNSKLDYVLDYLGTTSSDDQLVVAFGNILNSDTARVNITFTTP